mgnify:CR=1 FL=1
MEKLTQANNGLLLHAINRLIGEVNELQIEVEKLKMHDATMALIDPSARNYVDDNAVSNGKVD